jgi:hypothetical protein
MGDQAKLFDIPATGKKISRRRPVDLKVNKVNKDVAKRRYYLHKQLDKKMFKIDGAKRHIDTDYTSFENIPVGDRYYIGQLIELRYSVQYKIL